MFKFGKEEPIDNNMSLYEKVIGTNELRLDKSKGREINRYSFVSTDYNSNILAHLVCDILRKISLEAIIIVSWPISSPNRSRIASMVREKKYVNNGWETSVRNGNYFATREFKYQDVNSWPPFGLDCLDGGFLILISNKSDENKLSYLDEDCALFLANAGYFCPNDNFYRQLELGTISAMYQVNDDLNRPGLVFLGKQKISFESDVNFKIDVTYEGEQAHNVFT